MAQFNLHTTPDFEAELETLMKARGLRSKSEAVRVAVREAALRLKSQGKGDIRSLRGLVRRLSKGRQPHKDSRRLLAEIDREMEAKLKRLGGGR